MPAILFVCTANQIRSPFASAYFKKLISEDPTIDTSAWQVDSAGTWAEPGLPVESQLHKFGKEWGLSFNGHKTKQVNEKLLDSSDLIYVMEKGHLEALCYEFPQFSEKIKLLTECQPSQFEIDDPFGQNKLLYKKCLEDIAAVLASSFGSICESANH